MPFAVGSVDGGYSPGLYAAAGCYADPRFDTSRPDVGHANRAAAGFNSAIGSIPNPNARPGNANDTAGGNQQYGRG